MFGLGLTYLCVLVLPFSFTSLFVLLLFICLNTFTLHSAHLIPPLLLVLILCGRHDHHCRLPVFCRCEHASQNMPCLSICYSFCLVFAPAHDRTPYCTHPNRSAAICTQFWVFLAKRKKHHVRGNFPGHSAPIPTCTTLNVPRLPCCCVPRVPCAPTHPSAPICTHLNLFVPVCTHNWYVYMCNLIKKYTLNNVYFKFFILVSSYQ